MVVFGVLGCLIVVALGVLFAVKYLRGAEANRFALGEREQALDFERQRQRQEDAAATKARKARREKLHEKATSVRTADDAARLLREVTGAKAADN